MSGDPASAVPCWMPHVLCPCSAPSLSLILLSLYFAVWRVFELLWLLASMASGLSLRACAASCYPARHDSRAQCLVRSVASSAQVLLAKTWLVRWKALADMVRRDLLEGLGRHGDLGKPWKAVAATETHRCPSRLH